MDDPKFRLACYELIRIAFNRNTYSVFEKPTAESVLRHLQPTPPPGPPPGEKKNEENEEEGAEEDG